MADIPKLKMPFNIGANGYADTVEQDSDDEIVQCVTAIASTIIGTRVEQPEFGVPDGTFRQGGPDLEAIRRAMAEWEPRAATIITGQFDDTELTEFLTDIQARSKNDG